MLLDQYTMVSTIHKDPKYDVFFFVTNYSGESQGASYRYQAVKWLDRPSKTGDGKLVVDYTSKTRLQRDYNWKATPSTDARSRALAHLFEVVFSSDRNGSEEHALKRLVWFLTNA